MKRISSESRQSGAESKRVCCDCNTPLAANDDCGDRCIYCRPRLSGQAQSIGEERRQLQMGEREIKKLETLIRRLGRRC